MPLWNFLVVVCLLLGPTGFGSLHADVASGSLPAMAAGSPDSDSSAQRQQQVLNARVQSIDALLQAFRRIAMETGNAHQLEVMDSIVEFEVQQARKKYRRGDHANGLKNLERAYATVRTAIIKLRDGQTLTRHRRGDEQYQTGSTRPLQHQDLVRLQQSVDTLVSAYRRICEEKDQADQAAAMEARLALLSARANQYVERDDYSAANRLMGDAYLMIREALVALRDGDTLTQSLDFSSPADEYLYYATKTQSQITAIAILLDIAADRNQRTALTGVLEQAQSTRTKADELAANKQYTPAIALLDPLLTRLQSALMLALSAQ